MNSHKVYSQKEKIENKDYRALAHRILDEFGGEPHWTSVVMWMVENRDEFGSVNVDELLKDYL